MNWRELRSVLVAQRQLTEDFWVLTIVSYFAIWRGGGGVSGTRALELRPVRRTFTISSRKVSRATLRTGQNGPRVLLRLSGGSIGRSTSGGA